MNDKRSVSFVLNRVYRLLRTNQDFKALDYLMKALEVNRGTDPAEIDYLNQLLGQVDLKKLDSCCIVGVLRGTFRVRSVCGNWSILLEKAKQELPKRGMDYKRSLRGLLSNYET